MTVSGHVLRNGLYLPSGVPDVWSGKSGPWTLIYIIHDGGKFDSYFLPRSKKRAAQIRDAGYAFVSNWQAAHILIAGYRRSFSPFLKRYGHILGKRKILFFTHEPYCGPWGQHWERIQRRNVRVMTAFTATVWKNIFQYFPTVHDELAPPHRLARTDPMVLVEPPDKLNRTTVVMSSYRGNMHNKAISSAGGLYSLRNRIGIVGRRLGLVDIYGMGWPRGMSKGNSRGRYRETKPILLKPYHFHICFENTHLHNYVTEKLWDCIANYCLPIYMGSPWIYSWFEEDSFIDYGKLNNPYLLFQMVKEMTPEEWATRMNKCIDAYNRALEISDTKLDLVYESLLDALNELRTQLMGVNMAKIKSSETPQSKNERHSIRKGFAERPFLA
jgi:hypothetical protein